jgi:glycosyltransferase involved in cell wall biosynthesis
LKKVFQGLVEETKLVAVPNGIDYEQFDNGANKIAHRDKRLLYLSSIRERKGFFRVIQALPLVLRRHGDVSLTVAGEWQHENERERAMNLIKFYNIGDRINFVGEVSGKVKIDLYTGHNIFVFPPIEPEGMPWVILEAMSARLPVISTNQGAIEDVIENGKTGFIIEPTPENIADKICFLIENPAIALSMGELGRKRVETHFSETEYMNKMGNVLQEASTRG